MLAHNALLSGAVNLHVPNSMTCSPPAPCSPMPICRSSVRPCADFHLADLSGANLEGALLRYAIFMGADPARARFCRADLSMPGCTGRSWKGPTLPAPTCFLQISRGFRCECAFQRVAQFTAAWLDDCDLEFVRLPGADFHSAHLKNALLTGSQMPGAVLPGRTAARMADIEWEGADLARPTCETARFIRARRSGLVGSPIASEGSRTGFYTDEFHEQDFKDARGDPQGRSGTPTCARVSTTSTSTWSTRGAKYSDDQEDHFRRCGAILGGAFDGGCASVPLARVDR